MLVFVYFNDVVCVLIGTFLYRYANFEDVQYFKFDASGNMFIYEPGSGFTGDYHVLSPGDELLFDRSLVSKNVMDNTDESDATFHSDLTSQSACDGAFQSSVR